MGRISRADREQAEDYIRQSLYQKITDLEQTPSVLAAKTKALEALNKKVKYTETETHMESIQQEIDELIDQRNVLRDARNKRIKNLGWQDKNYRWDYEDEWKFQKQKAVDAALENSDEGDQIRELKGQLTGVGKKIFLATSHESLAVLVEELS